MKGWWCIPYAWLCTYKGAGALLSQAQSAAPDEAPTDRPFSGCAEASAAAASDAPSAGPRALEMLHFGTAQ
jgi:hypothetical protein